MDQLKSKLEHMNPTLTVLESNLRLKIEEHIIDYRVSYNVTGKVYAIKPLIFKLPKAAQKLILGKDPEEMIAEIDALGNLIQLMIPLGIVNKVSFLEEELKDIIVAINEEIKSQGINKDELYELAEKESLAFYIFAAIENPDSNSNKHKKILEKTAILLKYIEKNSSIYDLQYIGYHYPQFYFKILPLFLPFIKDDNIRSIAYEQLEYYVDEKCISYLLDQLTICKDGSSCSGIFRALSKQNTKGTSIQDHLISFYDSDIKLSEYALRNLMKILKYFPNEQTFRIGKEIVKRNTNYASINAARMLEDIGFPPKEIAEIVLPKLLVPNSEVASTIFCNSDDSEVASTIFRNSDELMQYLPSIGDLLKIYVNTIANKDEKQSISYSMSIFVKKKYNASISSEIASYLTSDNPNILHGILVLISHLLYEPGIDSKPFIKSAMIVKSLDLINHESITMSDHAIKILTKIAQKEKRKSYILVLLKAIDLDKNIQKNFNLMSAINEILPSTGYENGITATYLKALEIDRYRVVALNGIRYSNDRKLKESLLYLKDDPNLDVRQAAEKLDVTS